MTFPPDDDSGREETPGSPLTRKDAILCALTALLLAIIFVTLAKD